MHRVLTGCVSPTRVHVGKMQANNNGNKRKHSGNKQEQRQPKQAKVLKKVATPTS